MAGGGAVVLGIGYVVFNWTMLRSHAAQESAEVVSQTMRDEQVQFTAREFSKELLNQLLHDDEIASTVASWTLRLLASIQEEIGALFVHILQQEQVVDEVNRLADKLVAYLCSSQIIQEAHAPYVKIIEGLAAATLFVCSGKLVSLAAPELGLGPGVGPLLLATDTSKELVERHCGYHRVLAPYAPVFTYVGIFLFVLVFILSAVKKLKDLGKVVGMMEGFGLPFPKFMTFGCMFCIIAGSVCYLTGVPVLMEWGAEFLFIFMVIATYYGHYKPFKEKRDEFNLQMVLKNLAIIGVTLMTIGFEVPEIGKDGTPLGLNGALGPLGEFFGEIYRCFRPYSFIFKYSGIVLFVAVFLLAGLNHLKNFQELVDINRKLGVPLPAVSAAIAVILLILGSCLFLTGKAVFMELGAEALLVFLVVATFFAHLPLMRTGDFQQWLHTLKNVSLAGACLMTIGAERVGGLLVDAISLQSSRDAAALWAYELVMREDVTNGFRDLVVTALQMDPVVEEAQQMAVQVVNRVLADEGTIEEAKRVLREALEDQELRNTAKESLWNIVMPWSSRPPNELKRALRSAEDLASLPSLTDDERALLRSLQARLKEDAKRGPDVSKPATRLPRTEGCEGMETEKTSATPEPESEPKPAPEPGLTESKPETKQDMQEGPEADKEKRDLPGLAAPC
ncbi:unnamed protein product [Effrenium voratum]|nr:unnamed protein product [Effrenium voratum]